MGRVPVKADARKREGALRQQRGKGAARKGGEGASRRSIAKVVRPLCGDGCLLLRSRPCNEGMTYRKEWPSHVAPSHGFLASSFLIRPERF